MIVAAEADDERRVQVSIPVMELVLAAALAAAFVSITVLFARPEQPSTRLRLRGRAIEWDRT